MKGTLILLETSEAYSHNLLFKKWINNQLIQSYLLT
jgi:hypothetical protein